MKTLKQLMSRIPLPRPTIRLRLTLLYGGLFLVSGAVLLAVTYIVVSNSTQGTVFATSSATGGGGLVATDKTGVTMPVINTPVQIPPGAGIIPGAPGPEELQQLAGKLTTLAAQQHNQQMQQLLIGSGIALGAMAILAIGFGWLMAGRVLRPLRTMTSTARSISASNLHQRIPLDGPNDELTELGSTFNALLGRLEQSFEAQRQFIANASHELRTPLARQRAVAEVALRDPGATVATLRDAHERVVVAGEQQERLIEALLVLARSERELETRGPFDLADAAGVVLASRTADIERQGLTIESHLESAVTWGDARLAERVVTNLVDNATRYNAPAGRIDVLSAVVDGRATLRVSNTGPKVSPEDVVHLTEPFRRAGTQRMQTDGLGLGLSIVNAIVAAHGGTLELSAREGGGLEVVVEFPGPGR
ncbi:MAG: HAMP domain-containing histidine kinase, partial [Candidatus Dormibacteraeota bacterium]|nr:HAMP domain-containing histidine kinase [Candidatus Dormibacteraeota bacterium]